MNRGFWDNLNKPIFALAPMANVTDASMRQLIAKYGKPDVFWTEFVSVDGLVSAGKEKLLVDFLYSEAEHPIVAQVFGAKPENFLKVAKLVRDLGFDGMDINMGCPDRAVMKQGAGGALIKNPALAKEIVLAAKDGMGDLPVSIKTRTGFGKDALEEWLPHLFEVTPAVITLHARTVKELSLVPAKWDQVAAAVQMVNSLPDADRPLIFGNGDVMNLIQAEQMVILTGADGVMIGRAIFGNPWLFSKTKDVNNISIGEKLSVMLEHTFLFEKMFVGRPIGGKSFEVMKKHYKAYVNGFEGAKELRLKLMQAKDSKEVEKLVQKFSLTKVYQK